MCLSSKLYFALDLGSIGPTDQRMGIFNTLLHVALFQLTFGFGKQGLFRKAKIANYIKIETAQWPKTLVECCGFCLATPQCHGVIFEKGQSCTAITMDMVAGGNNQAWILLDRFQEDKKCYRSEWDYKKHDVKPGVASTGPKDCQSKCQQEDQCHYWSFNSSAMKCYMKKATAPTGGEYYEWGTTGPKYCPLFSNTIEKDCFFYDTEYLGNYVASQPNVIRTVDTAEECQFQCFARRDCYHWSFTKSIPLCILKTQVAHTDGKYNLGVISGPKNCP